MKTTLSHSNQPTIESLQAQVEELTAKVRWYEEQFRLSQQKQFGTSSEKTPNNQIALELFNEAEKESDSETPEPAVETITYRRKKNAVIGMSLSKTFRLKRLNIVYLMNIWTIKISSTIFPRDQFVMPPPNPLVRSSLQLSPNHTVLKFV